jgi:pectate lyase
VIARKLKISTGALFRHLLIVCASLIASNLFAADAPRVPAFPGAEGHGSITRGGRGGKVIAVTNLKDSGPGSFRNAVETEGPRIVVFRVSGAITMESPLRIKSPYITIAGQTAPGDGITIRKHPLQIDADEVVIRYIRVRLGDEAGVDADAISSRYRKNIILDHVSASWSIDETVSIYHCENVTVQWCLISESLYGSHHVKGAHGFGGIWGSNYGTYHHNLLAHHSSRNPRFASGCGYTDYRNNVVFNWGHNSAYGGEKQQVGNPKFAFSVVNMVANYYKPGPATQAGELMHRIVNPSARNSAVDYGKWYVADNVVYGNKAVTANNWNGGVQPQHGSSDILVLKLLEPWPSMPINQQAAEEAYLAVLADAGVALPKRDTVDARIVEEVRGGYATYEGAAYKKDRVSAGSKKSGIIDSQTDVGGWPELKSLPAPRDSDGDGMPDAWEEKFGLDPHDAADAALDTDGDGYTNVEEFLNGTDPTQFVDYTLPENNRNTLRKQFAVDYGR